MRDPEKSALGVKMFLQLQAAMMRSHIWNLKLLTSVSDSMRPDVLWPLASLELRGKRSGKVYFRGLFLRPLYRKQYDILVCVCVCL